ncbi:hypothetical protein H0264_15430 [Nocardia huaxiensis]|uniref:Uncharacterized protein n=1 Tax=Nocardia huaxiensis TaxID=2755382 RepID=A0A7D6VMU7_9NOCA|nr:hypothetical protein [Nocardia huaxiensis]QLY33436.1 hypothetical protein H0264_15430 [Nocardia huaxiensis]
MTEPDPQLAELAEQRAALRAEFEDMDFGFMDEFAGVGAQLDQLIAGLDEIGRELDEALERIQQAE